MSDQRTDDYLSRIRAARKPEDYVFNDRRSVSSSFGARTAESYVDESPLANMIVANKSLDRIIQLLEGDKSFAGDILEKIYIEACETNRTLIRIEYLNTPPEERPAWDEWLNRHKPTTITPPAPVYPLIGDPVVAYPGLPYVVDDQGHIIPTPDQEESGSLHHPEFLGERPEERTYEGSLQAAGRRIVELEARNNKLAEELHEAVEANGLLFKENYALRLDRQEHQSARRQLEGLRADNKRLSEEIARQEQAIREVTNDKRRAEDLVIHLQQLYDAAWKENQELKARPGVEGLEAELQRARRYIALLESGVPTWALAGAGVKPTGGTEKQ